MKSRNDPCPCGSGKKYKKCCLLSEHEIVRIANEEADRKWLEWFQKDCEVGAKNLKEYQERLRGINEH